MYSRGRSIFFLSCLKSRTEFAIPHTTGWLVGMITNNNNLLYDKSGKHRLRRQLYRRAEATKSDRSACYNKSENCLTPTHCFAASFRGFPVTCSESWHEFLSPWQTFCNIRNATGHPQSLATKVYSNSCHKQSKN